MSQLLLALLLFGSFSPVSALQLPPRTQSAPYQLTPPTPPLLSLPRFTGNTGTAAPQGANARQQSYAPASRYAYYPQPQPPRLYAQHTSSIPLAGSTTITPPQETPQQITQPVSPVAQPSDFVSQMEADILADTNLARQQNGLPPLTLDNTLASVARAHSAEMLANDYFSHTGLNGCTADCRLTSAGYPWQAMAENMHMMSGYNYDAAASAQKVVADWMNSPEHRTNLLSSTYTKIGIGVAASGSTVYTTADYAAVQAR